MNDAPGILLVEDNADEAELARRALVGMNCSVELAHDGVEALDVLMGTGRHARQGVVWLPRVVMLDLKLPGLDGLEVLRRIRAEPAIRLIPVVVLTSSSRPTEVRRAYTLGANSYLVKPVDFDEFLELMKQTAGYWLGLNVVPPS